MNSADDPDAAETPADPAALEPKAAPTVFVSYTWDNEEHIAWVLKLATRLTTNGVNVILDRWDTRLGSDLPYFMEQAANIDYRVLAIVSTNYTSKTDSRVGGAGYEAKVITPTIMDDLTGERVVPVLRNNPGRNRPVFLASTKYVDMRDDEVIEEKYFDLLQDLHDIPVTPKPPLGPNPFAQVADEQVPLALRHDPARYVSPALAGSVSFDYTNNSGRYVIGAGDRAFTLAFSTAGHGSIHVLNDPSDIRTVALAEGVTSLDGVGDPSAYDGSSRSRTVRVGDAAVLRNQADYWAIVFVDDVQVRGLRSHEKHSITLRYSVTLTPSPSGRFLAE